MQTVSVAWRAAGSPPQGLKETGYVEGQNVAVEYRWAENQYERTASETSKTRPGNGAYL
jgi:hypothetical protein